MLEGPARRPERSRSAIAVALILLFKATKCLVECNLGNLSTAMFPPKGCS
jgi:hypothetical protein